ncbi:DUF1822 family protein [Anabaena sp. FACHB-709]|uniref:DUF1822 domain-containing protein n=3 Tax=Nostocales TaxID=1161 RepID=A0A1Z4KRY5_ANAVA|nr:MULTISPECIES: DUF1822 family protein [Nostocaceae]BAY71642.1 hypothetical protein NIES23_44620 [Trichormus variabilis NIES-23]HBW31152.1 DUF1822 domain-containing protein [Nostoc sp. UBA8866]MBD2172492.1 DUF1822 family protein [Anabaena cylindrica FACHB-318]MBD2264041.1 DUF1822 family protein [Anabaena sp. FACHB-709]MBD2273431.1 DUF1822 family protein [Nostoc sp. PCC 7120 = FACHB-418]
MIKNHEKNNKLRLLLSESIWLEPECFDSARKLSQQVVGEFKQWQTYLNVLASLGFAKWLKENLPEQLIKQNNQIIDNFTHIQLGEFKFCLIVTEHLLDELVNIPEDTIIKPEAIAHLYVVVEVLEEQAELVLRGILRYDQLVSYRDKMNLQPRNGCYQLPLAEFDPEPNHILFYCRFLDAHTIPLPVLTTVNNEDNLIQLLPQNKTKLSQWLRGIFLDEWQSIAALINPDINLALNIRNNAESIKRGKIINLEMQLGNYPVVMLVNIKEEAEEKLRVLIQLHPSGETKFLQPNLKLTLLSKAGKSLCEVISRSQDSYIQLNPFQGEIGKQFSIEVSLDNITIKENFEL